MLKKSEPVQGRRVNPGCVSCLPGPCPCGWVTPVTVHVWEPHRSVQQCPCRGAAPPNPPQPLFLHPSLLVFGRMSERDIQSLSKWVFVLTLCLTTLWGRLTLASTHHRSHSGRGSGVLAACVPSPCGAGGTLGSLWDNRGGGLRGAEMFGEGPSIISGWEDKCGWSLVAVSISLGTRGQWPRGPRSPRDEDECAEGAGQNPAKGC